jgi:hypothetical protein
VFLCVSVSKVFPPLFFFWYIFWIYSSALENHHDVTWKSSFGNSSLVFLIPFPPLEKYNSGRRQKLFLFRVREYWTITGETERERESCVVVFFVPEWVASIKTFEGNQIKRWIVALEGGRTAMPGLMLITKTKWPSWPDPVKVLE